MIGKIAVLMAGPIRYAPLVVENLNARLRMMNFDVLAFIWKSDKGNKARENDDIGDIDALVRNPQVATCIVAEPFPEEFYSNTIGTTTKSNSTINATMGMFFSMSALCRYMGQLPNASQYSHALRIRTDCAIISEAFVEKLSLDPEVLTVSRNPAIPDAWISDHVTFGTRENIEKLWGHESIGSIYEAYRKGGRNPERTLAWLAQTRLTGVQIRSVLSRFEDYHIVYTPPRDSDPSWISRALTKGGITVLFRDAESWLDPAGAKRFRKRMQTQQNDVEREFSWKGRVRRFLIDCARQVGVRSRKKRRKSGLR